MQVQNLTSNRWMYSSGHDLHTEQEEMTSFCPASSNTDIRKTYITICTSFSQIN